MANDTSHNTYLIIDTHYTTLPTWRICCVTRTLDGASFWGGGRAEEPDSFVPMASSANKRHWRTRKRNTVWKR